ncbi:MAG TPA: hypothetical protein VEV45_23230 [Streptosporangiaceae bacterium]|nr:hypothetical protein [Streptosporangiaceae bacterium]
MPWRRHSAHSPEDEFADEVIGLVQDLLGLKATKLDNFALQIARPGGTPIQMNLHNVYIEARSVGGDERAQRLRTAILAMVPSTRPATWTDAAPRLLPAVRAASWVAASFSSAPVTGRSAMPFARPLVPFVSIMCAIDSEHAMTFATDTDLAAWDVTDEQAIRTASDNLARMPIRVARSGPEAAILDPDGYISSWLAVPSVLAQVAANLGSTVVALAPSRDRLILVDAEDEPAAVRVLETALQEYQSAPRQLSPVPYLVRDGGVEPWQPPAGHPARRTVDNATRILAAVEYGQQQSRLEDELLKAGEDVFIAKYSLMQRQDGSMWSWTAWVKQVTNGLIPQADVVLFGDNDNQEARFAVRWGDAVRLAGQALHEEAAFDPPRWRYRGWPDSETKAALREQAVPFPPPA